MAAMVGFDTVWIELEHGTPSYTDVEIMCMAIEAGGAVPAVRLITPAADSTGPETRKRDKTIREINTTKPLPNHYRNTTKPLPKESRFWRQFIPEGSPGG